jgi:pSer/pThr/pTyr-binding forkhead associated (FHA) protein
MGRPPTVPPIHQQPPTPELPSDVPRLVIVHLDGTEQGSHTLQEGDNLVGREAGGILAEDGLLSSRHAVISLRNGTAMVRDEGSRNGIYVRVGKNEPVILENGDQFCFGRIILRYEAENVGPAPGEEGPEPLGPGEAVGQLALVVGRDVDKSLFPVPIPRTEGVTLGRSRAAIRFPNDGWVSGLHCEVTLEGDRVVLIDRDSSNGTYLRIKGSHVLRNHDAILMGQRIFHIHIPGG